MSSFSYHLDFWFALLQEKKIVNISQYWYLGLTNISLILDWLRGISNQIAQDVAHNSYSDKLYACEITTWVMHPIMSSG